LVKKVKPIVKYHLIGLATGFNEKRQTGTPALYPEEEVIDTQIYLS
jgi:hypothetical protein